MSVILVLGSGPNVVTCREWSRAPFDKIVAINNAWAVRSDWDVLIHPDDFPTERHPLRFTDTQSVVRSNTYVPAQNELGGFVYAGGTMAFTAGYWVLATQKPHVIAMLGCDMVYPKTQATHFYGTGAPDPLRTDISLRSLEAKSARFMIMAAQRGCAVVNLSQDESRLIVPRATPDTVRTAKPKTFDIQVAQQAKAQEARLGYYVPSGKYWKEEKRFDTDEIDALDALWLKAAQHS